MTTERSPTLALGAARPARPSRLALVTSALLAWTLILTIGFAPLPLGSVWPMPGNILGLAGGLLLVIAALGDLAGGAPATLRALWLPLALAALTVIWIVLQILPLGYTGDAAPWDMVDQILGVKAVRSISLDRQASLGRLLHLLTYAAIFLAAWRVAQERAGAALLVRAVAIIGTAYSAYGIIVYANGNHALLWFAKYAYHEDLTSTFVNRNSFATFAGLSLLANVALLIEVFLRKIDARSPRTLMQSSLESVLVHGRWAACGVVITGAALLFSHSRGGTSATIAGTLALVALATSLPSLRGPWRTPFAILMVAGALALGFAGAGRVIDRVGNSAIDEDARVDLLHGTIEAAGDNGWVGTGLGSFRYVYPAYQAPSAELYAIQAHNDYVESALELGIPGAVIFLAIPLSLAVICFFGARRRRRDALYPCLGFAASALAGTHALVDFSLQIPAVTLIYATLLGLGVAQAASSRERAAERA